MGDVAVPAAPPTVANPFLGLRRFDIEDSAMFFGRDEQTYDVLGRLRLLHFVAVIGPSGCGKSSLIRAGVLAALAGGYMADRGPWTIVQLQPGNDPLRAWRNALNPLRTAGDSDDDVLNDPARALGSANRLVILVDQFEELFQYADRTGRDRDARLFLRALLSAASQEDSDCHLIITMRTEYLARCAAYPGLTEAINAGLYLVPRMTRDQMRDAIVLPIRKAGAEITAPLVDRLLNDVAEQTDPLPVLQHALMRMWRVRRAWEPLGIPDYEKEIGGQTGDGMGSFLTRHANDVLQKLDAQGRGDVRPVFVSLAELSPEGRAIRRASTIVDIVESSSVPRARVEKVVEEYRKEGFLNVFASEDAASPLVDVTHEAVARQWRELRGWLEEEARTRRGISHFRESAKEWEDHNRDKSYLFRGPRLAEARGFLRGRERQMDALGVDFLQASGKAEVWNRLLSPKVMGGVLVLLTMVSLVVFAQHEREVTQVETNLARQAKTAAEQAKTAAALQAQSAELARQRLSSNDGHTPAGPDKPLVYLQIRDASQRDQAALWTKTLRDKGYTVPPPELLKIGPDKTELRYFRPSDAGAAQVIADLLDPTSDVPRDVRQESFSRDTLTSALNNAASTLTLQIEAADSHVAEMKAELPALSMALQSALGAEMAAEVRHPGEFKAQFSDCASSIKSVNSSVTSIQAAPDKSWRVGLMRFSGGVSTYAGPGDVVQRCENLNAVLDSASKIDTRAIQTSRQKLESLYKLIDQQGAQRKAAEQLAPLKKLLSSLPQPSVTPVPVQGYGTDTTASHFELWFASPNKTCLPYSHSFYLPASTDLQRTHLDASKTCDGGGKATLLLGIKLSSRARAGDQFKDDASMNISIEVDSATATTQAAASNGLDQTQAARATGPAADASRKAINDILK